MDPLNPDNRDIADALFRVAELLEAQDGDRFRVRAYRQAARTIERSGRREGEKKRV